MKAGYRAGQLLGYRRMFLFGAGVALGLLIAPMAGRELRAKLQALAAPARHRRDVRGLSATHPLKRFHRRPDLWQACRPCASSRSD